MKKNIGVLISGGGSNLQVLIDACADPDFPAQIGLVVSNVPTAFGLERAQSAGVGTQVVDHKQFSTRGAFDQKLIEVLKAHGVERICLAGFMRLVSSDFLKAFPAGVMNVHPALLPAFPGMHGARQALEYGTKLAGCTVHFVDSGTDTGPIIAQAAVPVLPNDTEASLQARIQVEEHKLYPQCLRLWCEDKLRIEGRRVTGA